MIPVSFLQRTSWKWSSWDPTNQKWRSHYIKESVKTTERQLKTETDLKNTNNQGSKLQILPNNYIEQWGEIKYTKVHLTYRRGKKEMCLSVDLD